jgi:heme exporter protein C
MASAERRAAVASGRAHDIPAPPRWLAGFAAFALLFFIASQVIGFVVSPPERDMGNLQKILYVHVPSAWNAMIAFFIVFLASVAYAWKRQERFDLLAASAAEVGVVLTALTLALGSIWGRATWGIWWTWDPRLTSTAVMLLIYAGYLALRAFTEDEERRARWSAAVGILAFLNVPIVYMSVRWWRTLHQPQSSPETVDSPYVLGLRMNAFAFLFLLIVFVAARYYIARMHRAADALQEERALEGGSRA